MKTLWFKARYASPILSGEKRDTIRRRSNRYRVGEIVALTIGPRPSFAIVRIVAIEPAAPESLDPERRATINDLLGTEGSLDKITFEVLGRENGN